MAETDWGWQGKCTSLVQRMEYILKNNVVPSHQVVFRCGQDETEDIFAHKLVLASGSEPFYAMFYGTAAERNKNAIISVTDVEPVAFKNLMRYFYTDQVDGITAENVMATLYCAKKYRVPALIAICRQKAEQIISHHNACHILIQARCWQEHELGALAFTIIDRQTENVLNSHSFLAIDHGLLCDIVKRQTLSISEIDLYSAVRRWAEKNNYQHDKSGRTLRALIGLAIYDIKFPLMTMEELSDGPFQDGVLTPEEVKDIVLYLHAKTKPAIKFGSNLRKPVTGPLQLAQRFQSVLDPKTDVNFQPYLNHGGKQRFSNDSQQYIETFRFYTDKNITVLGCGLYGSCGAKNGLNLRAELQMRAHLYDDPSFRNAVGLAADNAATHSINISIASETRIETAVISKFSSDGTKTPHHLMFSKPVAVRANVRYTVTALITGPPAYYGTSETKVVQLPYTAPVTQNSDIKQGCIITFCDSTSTRCTPQGITMPQVAGILCTWS